MVPGPGRHVDHKWVHSDWREDLLSCGWIRGSFSLLICKVTAAESHLRADTSCWAERWKDDLIVVVV